MDSASPILLPHRVVDYDRKKALFIDGVNVFNSPARHCFELRHLERNVRSFVEAARNAGYHGLEIFIDAAICTPSTKSVWRKRRVDDLRRGSKKRTVLLASTLIGALARELQLDVHYSCVNDLDDVIASHASYHEGIIVSQDKDFFLYQQRRFSIANTWTITKGDEGKLMLTLQGKSGTGEVYEPAFGPEYILPEREIPRLKKRKGLWRHRTLNLEPMETGKNVPYPYLMQVVHHGTYMRGSAPAHLVREFGSPFEGLLPLTAIVMARLGHHNVLHEYPRWIPEERRAEWVSNVLDVDNVMPGNWERVRDLVDSNEVPTSPGSIWDLCQDLHEELFPLWKSYPPAYKQACQWYMCELLCAWSNVSLLATLRYLSCFTEN